MLCWHTVVSLHLQYKVYRHQHLKLTQQMAGLNKSYSILFKTSLSGVHIEEEEQEEEVDNSVRGRLRRLLEKVKKFREKKVEVEPEPQEDKKPSEPLIFCISRTTAIKLSFADQHLSGKNRNTSPC